MTQNSCLGYVPSGYNYIINPCFEINQRGVVNQTATNTFPVDMWKTGFGEASAASIPVCEGNMDYQQYLVDLSERGEPYPEIVME